MNEIRGFKCKEYEWLSNMYPCVVTMYGSTYPSVENAYQASKCKFPNHRKQFRRINPYTAKKLGKTVEMREDFEEQKLFFMETLLRRKFSGLNPILRDKLILTGDTLIVEDNHWGDTFWGVCNGVGENHLGKLIMLTRDELTA